MLGIRVSNSTRSEPGPQQQPATWDAVAPTYAEDVAQWARYAEEALRLVPPGKSDRVLDVACGPGTLAFLAARDAARVDATDFSPGMIEQLTARAAREGSDNVHGAVMDAQALGFPDATFDAAYSLFGFFFFPDRSKAFAELLRVLRPGGRALMATWGPIENRPLMKLGFDAIAEAVPQFPRPSKGDLQDPAECVREMIEAGFRDVSAQRFTVSVEVASADDYLDLIVRSGAPFAMMRKKLGEEGFASLRQRILEALRPRIPEGGASLAAESIFTVGTR
jgi:ubiquinone/menaquinone biosynthesis C-methylase UbiE